MIQYYWKFNTQKSRWELWYQGRKREFVIFVCTDTQDVYKYHPIIDDWRNPFAGGFFGHAVSDKKVCSSWLCKGDTIVQVLRNEDERDPTPLDVRVYRPSDIKKTNPVYVGIPK